MEDVRRDEVDYLPENGMLMVPMNVFESIADEIAACEQAIMNELNVVSNEVKNESIESVGVSLELGEVMFDGLDRIQAGAKIQSAFDEYEIVKKIGEDGHFHATGMSRILLYAGHDTRSGV